MMVKAELSELNTHYYCVASWTPRCIIVRGNKSFVCKFLVSHVLGAIILIFRSSDSKNARWRSKEHRVFYSFSFIIFLLFHFAQKPLPESNPSFLSVVQFLSSCFQLGYIYISASAISISFDRFIDMKGEWRNKLLGDSQWRRSIKVLTDDHFPFNVLIKLIFYEVSRPTRKIQSSTFVGQWNNFYRYY